MQHQPGWGPSSGHQVTQGDAADLANPIQSQTPASSTGATAGSGQLLPIQGSSGFVPEAEALPQNHLPTQRTFCAHLIRAISLS